MSLPEIPIGLPPPSWMVAPRLTIPAPEALPMPAPVTQQAPTPPVVASLLTPPPVEARPRHRSHTSGVEENAKQSRPWNLPAWK